jgi:hypothetical protein
LRQNRTRKNILWTFILFLRFWRKNKMNVRKYSLVHDFDAKRQRVRFLSRCGVTSVIKIDT